MANIDLTKYGITGVTEIVHNPSYDYLFKAEMDPSLEGFDKGVLTELGAVNVYIDEDDTLRKAITSPDWTKEFGSKDIDVAGFVRDMEDLVNGRKKKWICPFCGGHIVVLGKDGDENHIGCDSCDMRIDLSATLM